MSATWLWLTKYGPRNFEALLILVAIGALVGAGYWWRRRLWQDRERRLQLDLTHLQRQQEQLQNELAAAQRQNERFQGELGDARRQGEQLQGELAVAQDQIRQLQDELDKAQHQHGLDEARHQRELDEVRARYDPARIKERLDQLERVVAHEFKRGLAFIASQCKAAVAGLRADQPDLRIMLRDAEVKAYRLMQLAKIILWSESLQRIVMHWETLRTRGVLEEVVRDQLPHAESKDIRLHTEYGSLGPILTDRLWLGRVCDIVLDNAIDYSLRGGVVEITQRLEDETGQRTFIEVRDHGRGIPAKDHERIFELNERGDGLGEGSGLGLYLARLIARLLGGDLVLVESNNEGSLFRIILPCGVRSDSPQTDTTSEGETSE